MLKKSHLINITQDKRCTVDLIIRKKEVGIATGHSLVGIKNPSNHLKILPLSKLKYPRFNLIHHYNKKYGGEHAWWISLYVYTHFYYSCFSLFVIRTLLINSCTVGCYSIIYNLLCESWII